MSAPQRYATGAKPDPAGLRRTPVHHLFRRMRAVPLPSSFSIEHLAPPVFDQGQTGSCVGHAFACAIATALAAKGTPLSFVPSPAGIYTLARCVDRVPDYDGTFPALEDGGSMPNEAERGVKEWGVRPMAPMAPDGRYSDADPQHIDDEPRLVDLEADATEILAGCYGIYTSGSQRSQDVRAAVFGGYPVTLSVCGGSSAWQDYTSGVIGATGQPLDHETCIVGYETTSSGGVVFRIRNSWSAGYGQGGDVLVNEAALDEYADLIAWDVEVLP